MAPRLSARTVVLGRAGQLPQPNCNQDDLGAELRRAGGLAASYSSAKPPGVLCRATNHEEFASRYLPRYTIQALWATTVQDTPSVVVFRVYDTGPFLANSLVRLGCDAVLARCNRHICAQPSFLMTLGTKVIV